LPEHNRKMAEEAVKDQKDKPKVDKKAKAAEVLKELIRLTKSGKFPREIYEIILGFVGKGDSSEQGALRVRTFNYLLYKHI